LEEYGVIVVSVKLVQYCFCYYLRFRMKANGRLSLLRYSHHERGFFLWNGFNTLRFLRRQKQIGWLRMLSVWLLNWTNVMH